MPPPPPDLADGLLSEIFLRLPPDDIACLLRASLACRRWRRILADPAFRRRHRALHRTPSVLGFFRLPSSVLGLSDGFAHWARGRGFEVETILPSGALLAPRFSFANPTWMPKADVSGFAEGTDVIFLGTSTHIGHTGAVYMVQTHFRER